MTYLDRALRTLPAVLQFHALGDRLRSLPLPAAWEPCGACGRGLLAQDDPACPVCGAAWDDALPALDVEPLDAGARAIDAQATRRRLLARLLGMPTLTGETARALLRDLDATA